MPFLKFDICDMGPPPPSRAPKVPGARHVDRCFQIDIDNPFQIIQVYGHNNILINLNTLVRYVQ